MSSPPASLVARFFRGAAAPFHGLAFVARHPRLLGLVVAPIATAAFVTLLLGGLLLGLFVRFGKSLSDRLAGSYGGPGWLWLALALVAALGLGYLAFLTLLALARAPFSGLLAERVEVIVSGRRPPERGLGATLVEAGRDAGQAVIQLVAWLAVVVPLYLLALVVPPLVIVNLGLTALFIAYDFLDDPLANRGARRGEKWRFVRTHLAETLGFGAMTGLWLLIPVLNLFVSPFAVVGATLLVIDLFPDHA